MDQKAKAHLTYAVLAFLLGPLLIFDKIVNDVPAFDDLAIICADDVGNVTPTKGKGRWSYDKITLSMHNGSKAVLHGIDKGFPAAARAILDGEDFCVYFDADGRTKSIYHVTVDDSPIMSYEEVAAQHGFDVNGLFYIGLFSFLAVGPYQLWRYTQASRHDEN